MVHTRISLGNDESTRPNLATSSAYVCMSKCDSQNINGIVAEIAFISHLRYCIGCFGSFVFDTYYYELVEHHSPLKVTILHMNAMCWVMTNFHFLASIFGLCAMCVMNYFRCFSNKLSSFIAQMRCNDNEKKRNEKNIQPIFLSAFFYLFWHFMLWRRECFSLIHSNP